MSRTRAITKAPAKRPPRTQAEFEGHVNGLRLALGRVDALADALVRCYDERRLGGDEGDVIERRVSHLIDLTGEEVAKAVEELAKAAEALEDGVPDADWGDA